MEFHEKLQELRKAKGLTQEELAEALYVSRTAISKWESGRGYPSIDSMKEISRYFSVTIDDLLSGERLIALAEEENKANMQKMHNLLWGVLDLMALALIILPLYPNTINGHVYSVSLPGYAEAVSWKLVVYWILFVALILLGVAKILQTQCGIAKGQRLVTGCSLGLSILSVLILAMAREAYAVVVLFLLLVGKGVLLVKGR